MHILHGLDQNGKRTLYILLFFSFLPLHAAAANVNTFAPITPFPFDGDVRDLPLAPQWSPGDPIREIPRRGGLPAAGLPPPPANIPDSGPDPLLELQRNTTREPSGALSTVLNVAGQGFSGANPPDTAGEVGPNHYIQMINGSANTTFAIYDKSGVIQTGPTALDTLGSGNCATGRGDPIVLYDRLADRWLMSEFSGAANRLCVYISQTADPTSGGWFNYEFTTPNFPDYPKFAVWPDAYYVTTNEPTAPAIYAFERSKMLLGQPAASQRFTGTSLAGFGFQAFTPSDLDGATAPPIGAPNYAMRHRDDEIHNALSNDPSQDFLEIWEFHVDFATPADSTFIQVANIAITEFDSNLCNIFLFSCFSQPGSNTALDPIVEVIMWRLQYRNFGTHETLVGNFVTDVDDTDRGGIRWFELRKTADTWSLFQEGTFSIDATNRWMGSAAMDGSGNIAVVYNVSDDSSVHPGLRYAGRLESSAVGTLPESEFTLVSGTAANSSTRYGDYSSMNIDPADDCTFWVTGEYNLASQWSTRIGAFVFDSCGTSIEAIFADDFELGDTSVWSSTVP